MLKPLDTQSLHTDDCFVSQLPGKVWKHRTQPDGTQKTFIIRDPRKEVFFVTAIYKIAIKFNSWGKKTKTFYTTETPEAIDSMMKRKIQSKTGMISVVSFSLLDKEGLDKNEIINFIMDPEDPLSYKATRIVETFYGKKYPLSALTKNNVKIEMVGEEYKAVKEAVHTYNKTAWENA